MSTPSFPHLVTPLPGPKSQALVAQSEAAVTPSLPHAYPLAVKRAEGCMVEDLDDNRFLDCAAGIAVCSTGHCHPRVVQAIKDQSENLLHICGADFYDPQYVNLASRLAKLAPGRTAKKVFLGNSGTEAVEAAFKLARYHTGRSQVLSFFGSFHGRTMGSVSLTASKPVYHQGFGPLVSGITHLPYANCYRCPFNLKFPDCNFTCVSYIEEVVFSRSVPANEVAAIFVEPVQGEGGYIVPPPGWINRLEALCNRHGILLVADEVQSGIGRTGKMFAIEHSGVEPDILCSAKALASGLPLSAMIAKDHVMSWPAGSHGSTFGGNPVACAAAQATLDIVEEPGFLQQVTAVGERLMGRLKDLARTSRLIGDVRGLGLMIGVELVRDKETKERAKAETEAVVQACYQHGLLTLPCGPNSIRFSPPLILTHAEADIAFEIFAEALAEVEQKVFPTPVPVKSGYAMD